VDDYVRAGGVAGRLHQRAGRRCPHRLDSAGCKAAAGGRWPSLEAPAAAAGLQTGDELVRINGRPIIDGTDVRDATRPIGAGAAVVIDVVRDSQPVTIQFRAGAYTRTRAQLRDLPSLTSRMRRIRAGLVSAPR
jgi:hypothetical protein